MPRTCAWRLIRPETGTRVSGASGTFSSPRRPVWQRARLTACMDKWVVCLLAAGSQHFGPHPMRGIVVHSKPVPLFPIQTGKRHGQENACDTHGLHGPSQLRLAYRRAVAMLRLRIVLVSPPPCSHAVPESAGQHQDGSQQIKGVDPLDCTDAGFIGQQCP